MADRNHGAAMNGRELEGMFIAAETWLRENAGGIDDLNVFPVPDGDTGSNMLLTLKSALDEVSRYPGSDAGGIAEALARGALYGAGGNSGVILFQILVGISEAMRGRDTWTAEDLAAGILRAADLAYRGVGNPVEGTILTVIRDTAGAAGQFLHSRSGDIIDLLNNLATAAEASVARTPELLEVLRKADVVDAGGQGLYTILFGALTYFREKRGVNKRQNLVSFVGNLPPVRFIQRTFNAPDHYGYCTEFILKNGPGKKRLVPEKIRSVLRHRGSSIIVVGDSRAVRVHIHTSRPGRVLAFAERYGILHRISIRNMDEQYRELIEKQESASKTVTTSSVKRKVKIVTDSVADIPADIVKELGITVIPLNLHFGEEVFRDGIDMTTDEFYRRLTVSSDVPFTSTPSPGTFSEAYDTLAEDADEILVIMLSSKLSGTFEIARSSRELMKKECRVTVIDSGLATMAEGFIVMKAAEAAREGATLDECIAVVEENRVRSGFLCTFDTLEYLKKGGRIGAAQAFMGSVLKINPLITLQDGLIAPAGKTTSRSKAVDRLYNFVRGYTSIEYLAVEHTACPDEAAAFTNRLQNLLPDRTIYVSKMTPAIGTHTGPGLLLVAVLGDTGKD